MFIPDGSTAYLQWVREDRVCPKEKNSQYRRIGTSGDGNCMFHALARGLSEIYQLSYRKFPRGSKLSKEHVKEINKACTKARQFKISAASFPLNTVVEKTSYYEVVNPMLVNRYMKKFRTVFAELLRKQVIEIIKKNDNNVLHIMKTKLSGSVERFYPNNNPTAKEKELALKQAMKMYIENLDTDDWVSTDYLVLIGEVLGVDIYLIKHEEFTNRESTNSILYGGKVLHYNIRGPKDLRLSKSSAAERRSIVLYSVADSHYELVGKATCDQRRCGLNECLLVTNFNTDEPLVRALYRSLN